MIAFSHHCFDAFFHLLFSVTQESSNKRLSIGVERFHLLNSSIYFGKLKTMRVQVKWRQLLILIWQHSPVHEVIVVVAKTFLASLVHVVDAENLKPDITFEN